MASAEQLLNEAQYAFQRINSGESWDNRRNTARARSICRKIIRKYPASTEASSARAILKRLGDESYVRKPAARQGQMVAHQAAEVATPTPQSAEFQTGNSESLDWNGLLTKVFNQPAGSTVAILFVLFLLFSVFGSLLLVPIFALILILGPFKSVLKPVQRQKVDEWIAKINAHTRK